MPGTLYGFPFNEDLFRYRWENEPDPVSTALIDSGVMQDNAEIASQISTGSDVYTIPFYKTIGGDPANYDGATDMPVVETEGASQSGIVWGRQQGWKARDFVIDFNSGADPIAQIASQVGRFWSKYHQTTLVSILNGIFSVSDNPMMGGIPGTAPDPFGYIQRWSSEHTYNLASASGSYTPGNNLGATSIGDSAVMACGDMASGAFKLSVMHSTVANNLAGLGLLEFRKYTDEHGIERQLNIADINGCTVIVFDGVPVTNDPTYGTTTYTTYVLGTGAIQRAFAPIKVPVELARDPKTNGGEDELLTRVRLTMLPNGFSYTKQPGDGPSPTNEQLSDYNRWSPIFDPKSIAITRILSNG